MKIFLLVILSIGIVIGYWPFFSRGEMIKILLLVVLGYLLGIIALGIE